MKITGLKLYPHVVQRQYGTVIAQEGGLAGKTRPGSAFLFIEAATDAGITGWGEVSDVEDAETHLGDLAGLEEELNELMVGRSPYDVQQLHRELDERPDRQEEFGRCLSCALDMLMYDIQGRAAKRPIYDLLGGAVRQEVTISWVAYIREDIELIRAEIAEKVDQGFRAFKLKVGVDIDLDEERVAAAREVGGPDVSLKVDANEGWSVGEAVANIKRLNRYGLAGVETPIARANPAEIAAVRKQVDVPILEHVQDLQYALEVLRHDAVDVFNVATTGSGGLWPARRIIAMAESAGVGVLLGSTVEMGLGTLAQLHLAATVSNLALPSDLVGPGLYRSDVLRQPLAYCQGKLAVPTGAGLGGDVDPSALA